jgi:membrane protein required for beta-lactamase induction
MNRIKRRVWVIAGLYRCLLMLPIVGSSSSLRQISWWQLLLVLIGSENDVVVEPRHIILVAYNLVSLIVFIDIVAVVIVEGRVRDTHRGAHAARTTSLSLEQILFTSAVHELK